MIDGNVDRSGREALVLILQSVANDVGLAAGEGLGQLASKEVGDRRRQDVALPGAGTHLGLNRFRQRRLAQADRRFGSIRRRLIRRRVRGGGGVFSERLRLVEIGLQRGAKSFEPRRVRSGNDGRRQVRGAGHGGAPERQSGGDPA